MLHIHTGIEYNDTTTRKLFTPTSGLLSNDDDSSQRRDDRNPSTDNYLPRGALIQRLRRGRSRSGLRLRRALGRHGSGGASSRRLSGDIRSGRGEFCLGQEVLLDRLDVVEDIRLSAAGNSNVTIAERQRETGVDAENRGFPDGGLKC